MISNITTIWPPNPSPEQPQTGTKSRFVTVSTDYIEESLTDLHLPAWWSGLQIKASIAGSILEDAQFHVRLVTASGRPAFDAASNACEWEQANSEWQKLPWPISATMAKTMDLRIQITPRGCPRDVFLIIKTSFHEMPLMPVHAHYVYHDTLGAPIHCWNGMQNVEGTQYRNVDAPSWGQEHHRVPPSSLIPTEWYLENTLLFQSWNQSVA